jgi:hypothetical protein
MVKVAFVGIRHAQSKLFPIRFLRHLVSYTPIEVE